jgi:uncharacterized protein YukE
MADGIIDATARDIEDFGKNLEAFYRDLHESTHNLNGKLQRLGETWRDAAFQDFQVQFEEAKRNIDNFVAIAEEHSDYLKRKAAALYEAEAVKHR